MNICKGKKKPATELVTGNLYVWKETPHEINICMWDSTTDTNIMVRLRTGEVANRNPAGAENFSRYTDVTDKYCLMEIN